MSSSGNVTSSTGVSRSKGCILSFLRICSRCDKQLCRGCHSLHRRPISSPACGASTYAAGSAISNAELGRLGRLSLLEYMIFHLQQVFFISSLEIFICCSL